MHSGATRRVVAGMAGAAVIAAALAIESGCATEEPTVPPAESPATTTARLPDLDGIVADEDWARILGKALFWDQQVGSDGIACASCHFQAGADARISNVLSPGLLELPEADLTFGGIEPADRVGLTASDNPAGANYTVEPDDFPFHQVAVKDDRNSEVLYSTNDRLSSPGAYQSSFTSMAGARGGSVRDIDPEHCDPDGPDVFEVDGLAVRQVEPRHTPTVINAVFNHRNFWDGRANNHFNGVDPFGPRAWEDPRNGVIVRQGRRGMGIEYLDLPDASLASQAVGPPLSDLEMSCAGRSFPDIGRKLIRPNAVPLAGQRIDPDDSLFGRNGPKGDLRRRGGEGLRMSYRDLVMRAFEPEYWSISSQLLKTEDGEVVPARRRDGYTQMEHNFSMYWGLSLMLYQATLVSDRSRFDDAEECIEDPGCDPVAEGLLTELELDGHTLFNGFGPVGGGCVGCHGGEMLTVAAATADEDPVVPVLRTPQADGTGIENGAIQDEGFFNIGLRPTWEDLGVGGLDPYGNTLSLSRQYKAHLVSEKSEPILDGITVDPCDFAGPFDAPFDPDDCTFEPVGPAAELERVQVDGAFKTPGLRNVALTPPYFHYGGYKDLTEVVEFYAHGGNQRDRNLEDPSFTGDTSGTGLLGEELFAAGPDFGSNLDGLIAPLNLALDPGAGKDQDYGVAAIVAFMKTLTDRRVQCDQAPFDHPALHIPVAHRSTDADGDGRLDDVWVELPAVGASGYPVDSGLCIPNTGDLFAPGMQARVGGEPSDPSQFD